MGIVLACPALDGMDLTHQLMRSLADTVVSPVDFTFVIIDNGSEVPYRADDYRWYPFRVRVIRNDSNTGYYAPLLQAAALATDGDIVGLIHNDVIIYEKGWDQRVIQSFVARPDLGMIGFVGSDEVDSAGGRGGGTMCFFRGEKGQTQDAGKRVTDLVPAAILDSVVMLVRKPVIPALKIDENISICHFYDKIWPLRLYEAGWKTGVLGVEMDHMGGMTAVVNPRYHESAREWCRKHGLSDDDPGTAIYLDAENRFLGEYRAKRMIPNRMDGWNLVHA